MRTFSDLLRHSPRAPAFQAPAVQRVDFIVDDDLLRIEIGIAAQHRLLEADRARKQVDVVIDEAGQHLAAHDDFRTEAVAHFDRHRFAVGHQGAAGQLVRPADAAAGDLVAAVRGGNLGGIGFGAQRAEPGFGFHAGHCALVAAKLGLVERGWRNRRTSRALWRSRCGHRAC